MSCVDIKDVELLCTWEVGNNRKVEDTVTLKLSSISESCLENMVKFETCVHLLSKEDIPSPCELKLVIPRKRLMQITHVSIVSEARIVELYGQCGEYVTTTQGSFIDEFEDMSIYIAEAELLQPSFECLLKFLRPKRKADMWLYGIHVQLKKIETLNPTASSVNFQNVNKILEESGQQLTEKAEKCKKFLQLYGSTLGANKLSNKPDLQVLMNVIQSSYLSKCPPCDNDARTGSLSKCINDILPESTILTQSSSPEEQTSVNVVDWQTLVESSIKSELKQHIDQCVNNLERRLMIKVEERFFELEKRQNEKLDQILEQLHKLQINHLHDNHC